ncbi:BnaCnng22700D [Brassica napus]|uniref:(rape) hypothetical protein n=1 Tax=Brassica napus TaxID=3708 RepID=A0A078INF8_BRANA|nr:unnamed protein product [Brassica napus]CDY52585.1 BnaCnng22700D [Brassica napus]
MLSNKPMTAAAFSGDGTVLAVAAENVITLWNLDKNILLSVLGATLAPITKLCFAEKSEFLVAASHLTKPELSVWNTSKQSLSCSYGLRIEAVTSAVDSSAFAVLALIPETLKKKNMFHRRDGAILLFNGSDPNHVSIWTVMKAERGSISFLEGDDKSQLRLAYVNGSREYVVFDPRRVLQVTRRQKVSIFLGDFGYTSLYGQLPDYDKKRTESVESLATPFVSSERPWETIFSGSTLNFPPLQKLCGEFFESLMEKRTVVVEWVMIYTKKWLDNCLKKKNYTTFILLMVFVFLMLTIEGGNSHCNIFQIFCGKERDGNQTQEKAACSFVNGLSFSSQGVAFSSSVWFSSERRRWAFNFFHTDQQATRFTYNHKPIEPDHFKLVSRMLTSVEEDRLFYFSPRIYGTKLRQGSKVLNLWYTARVSSAFECVDASEILASASKMVICVSSVW